MLQQITYIKCLHKTFQSICILTIFNNHVKIKEILTHTLENKQLKIASKLTLSINVSNTHVRRQMITKIIISLISLYKINLYLTLIL